MKKLLIIVVSILISLIILNFIFPLKVDIDFSRIVYDRNGEILTTFLSKDDKWRFQSSLSEINDDFLNAIVYKEDKYFYYHFGFNPIAIIRATFTNIYNWKIVSGASTITMQLARLLEPKERNISNKIIEVFRAIQLELYYSKDEILNMYIDLLPYGSNIEGVKSASIFFLNKKPNSLSLSESIALSLIPNNPNKYNITKKNNNIDKYKNELILQYKNSNLFDKSRLKDALIEKFNVSRIERPILAPHLSTRLLSENRNINNIHSTLDLNLQSSIEKITKSYILGLNSIGIFNVSILAIENRTGNVVTYIGSNDFYDNMNAGQVDGVQSIRSPGSTLKPLVYLLAVEEGIVTPKTILLDIPYTFGDYSPLNFDKKFNGQVSVEKALAQSLNVPAVYLLNEIGTTKFIEKLVHLEFTSIKKNKNKLGLSVVLGGCGVSLEELTKLYFSIANDGKYVPINYLSNKTKDTTTKNILELESTQIVKEMLSQLTRPDYPSSYKFAYNLPKISWKTGTSYGRRDAWSIGFTDNYTLGVWIGNFNNKGAINLTGASISTPLLFDVFSLLEKNSKSKNERIKISQREVCSKSGLLPSKNCSDLVEDYFVPFKSTSKICNHLEEVYISNDEKIRYCSDCIPPINYKIKLIENIEPLLLDYYIQNNITYQNPIPHNPECKRVFKNKNPIITSPIENHTYLIEKGKGKILFSSILSHQSQKCNWFINNQLFRSSNNKEVFFTPEKEGQYKITCTDNQAQSTTIYIEVRFY